MSEDSGFKQVVLRIYELAKTFYENDINTHIQAIYNRLTDTEQGIFLKGMIPHIFEVETPPQAIVCGIDDHDDEFDIEQFNQVELIRLKSWLVKCLIIVIGFFVSMVSIYIFIKLLAPHEGMEGGPLEEIEKFIEALLDL